MASPYFVSVDPSLAKLRMFFGRRREIRAITDYLRNGDSVLLIGERRIGKTFLLYMLGDPTGKGADFYETLLDRKTGILLAELRRTTTSCGWAYVDLLSVTNAAGFCFRVLAELGGEQAAKDFPSSELDHADFVATLRKLSTNLSRQGKRAVVLVDESEKLLKLDQSANLLACLKAAIQQCDSVDFLLAGDIKPQHQAVPEFASLQGALQVHYLAPLDTADALGLIRAPVEGRLSFDDQVLERILDLTGCKPSLIQVLCGHLYELVALDDTAEIHATLADFDSLWESSLRSKVFESFGGPLRGFFEDLQGHERNVFAFLAHHPLAAEEELVKALGINPASVRSSLHNLQITHRITKRASGYRLSAKIVEEFGCHFVALPVAQSPQTTGDEQEESPLRNKVWGSIEAVERRLRQLIVEVFCQRGWRDLERVLAKRHPDFYAHCSETRDRSKSSFKRYESIKQAEENILDYSFIGELGQLIARDWEFFRDTLDFGKGTTRENKRYWTEMMEAIAKVRNALAHHRYVPENELKRAEVYCNDISHTLHLEKRMD